MTLIKHICKQCNKSFNTTPDKMGKFCSNRCKWDSRKGWSYWKGKVGPRYSKYGILEKTCPVCKTKFHSHNQPSRQGRDTYCSRKCLATDKVAGHWKGKKRLDMTGEFNNMWKGGITPLRGIIRGLPEYKIWNKSVFNRDDYTCNECGSRGGKLHAHHIVKFSKLFSDFLKLYSQFSPIDDKDTLIRLAYSYKPFWDVSNGKTMCKMCHIESHKMQVHLSKEDV